MVPAFVPRLERRLHLSREGLVWVLLSSGMLATGTVVPFSASMMTGL